MISRKWYTIIDYWIGLAVYLELYCLHYFAVLFCYQLFNCSMHFIFCHRYVQAKYTTRGLRPVTTTLFPQRSTQILKIPEIVFINDESKNEPWISPIWNHVNHKPSVLFYASCNRRYPWILIVPGLIHKVTLKLAFVSSFNQPSIFVSAQHKRPVCAGVRACERALFSYSTLLSPFTLITKTRA